MATTALTAVIDGLITNLSASAALAGVRIFDGVEIDSSFPGDFITVGHDGSDDGEVVVANSVQQFLELGNRRQFEDASVNCQLVSWNGGVDVKSRRNRAFALLSAVDTAIRADVSLGGACLYSTLDNYTTFYRQTNVGVAVYVTFTVTYRART